jgi:hypothetical protein
LLIVNRITRIIPCYTCLKSRPFFWSKSSMNSFLNLHVILTDWTWSINHHTHTSSNHTRSKQWIIIRTVHQTIKEIWKLTYALLRTHRREKHANRSYGEQETSTKIFTLLEIREKENQALFILITAIRWSIVIQIRQNIF